MTTTSTTADQPAAGPAWDELCNDLECAVPAHVNALTADPGPIGAAVGSSRVALHGAIVDIADDSLIRVS